MRANRVDYGLTADTGGHIRYLLELVRHAGARPEVTRQEVVTRLFRDEGLGPDYAVPRERLDAKTEIVRLEGATDAYLDKESLWRDHDALAEGLIAYIRALPSRPDLLHAHYADAGELARRVKTALGIPYVFTGHSLGRVKAIACGQPHTPRVVPSADDTLARRIRTEEDVIASADRIVASSCDEAELQYGTYANVNPARIVVNPPGTDLTPAGDDAPRLRPALREAAERFLTDPAKPQILALARPVAKKNLAGLIRAYAGCPALQQAANLVIYAGTRGDLRRQEPENRAVLEELLYLVDRYDLWGRVALPKTHEPEDVPAIYAEAARSGGVFANPALNEPFGLTLLEAAAGGLPVVATSSGGPTDIVARLRNGVLVDPTDPEEIAAGMLSLLTDRARWAACAQAGLDRCGYYDWARHAGDYAQLCRQVSRAPQPLAVARKTRRSLIASDIDGTLTGDADAADAFARWQRRDAEHYFAIATGRSLHAALRVLREWSLPMPDALVTSVGAEVYYARLGGPDQPWALVRDEAWPAWIGQGWDHAAVFAAVSGVPGVTPQPPREQRPHKASFFCADADAARRVRERLAAAGLPATVIFSHAELLDVLPARASKGAALDHLRARLRVARADTIACGDSGNDEALLRAAGHPVVVANHSDELRPLIAEGRVFVSSHAHAGGVLDGITAFGARRACRPAEDSAHARSLSRRAARQRADDRSRAGGAPLEPGARAQGTAPSA